MKTPQFSYNDAFSRNIGWFTALEQQVLRSKKIAIAGMGGVGGTHLLTLARLGLNRFHIADFDFYEVANFNRQVGASMKSIGAQKAQTMHDMLLDINPESDVTVFSEGVSDDTIDAFLEGVDLYVDGLDFFVLDMRRKVFARCAELGIPAITAGPIGMGTAYLVFMPGHMTFEDYFALEGLPPEKQYVNFLLGLSPKSVAVQYLVDDTRLNLAEKYGPSTMIACQLCAGVVGAEAIKILLKRGRVYAAPYYHLFDAYKNKHVTKKLSKGSRNMMHKLKLAIAYKVFSKKVIAHKAVPEPVFETPIERILNVARWAPSGDNAQPWRFKIQNSHTAIIYCHDASDENIYEFKKSFPSLLSTGMLLENIALAASAEQKEVVWTYEGYENNAYKIQISLEKNKKIKKDDLLSFVKHRSVNRKKYKTTPLTSSQKTQLADSLGETLNIYWYASKDDRKACAKLNAQATDIRISIPETFKIHGDMLEWKKQFSEDKIPVQTLPLSPMTKMMNKWLLKKWGRLNFFCRYLGGTFIPKMEMDMAPGMACAAHFMIARTAPNQEGDITAILNDGRALQRFWLTLTKLGLVMQPAMATLTFAYYGQENVPFTSIKSKRKKAQKLAEKFADFWKKTTRREDMACIIFNGRIGLSQQVGLSSRSVRKQLKDLLVS